MARKSNLWQAVVQFYNEALRPVFTHLFGFLEEYPEILVAVGVLLAILTVWSFLKKQFRRMVLYTVFLCICLLLSDPLWAFFCKLWELLAAIRPYLQQILTSLLGR